MKNKKSNGLTKIRIGRLAIDPVFLLLLLFSLFSVIILGIFVWYAS
ncbi:MAG: hypothetical protein K9L56_03750 [Clostridiales bacterium]|nr:hypothetical protein [Clostridiales bacterium]